jgi:hypothetical protein
MEENRAKLGAKIAAAAKAFGAVSEDGENKHSSYNYISSNKMVMILREHLSDHSLSIIPEVLEMHETSTTFTSSSGNESTWIRTTVKMSFEIIDTETGFSMTKTFFGADQDTGGKSSGQAITECTKRFYFKLFQISSKDETDPDSKTTTTPTQKPKAQDGGFMNAETLKSFVDSMKYFKLYGREKNQVYWNDIKYTLSPEQAEWCKKHPKFKES